MLEGNKWVWVLFALVWLEVLVQFGANVSVNLVSAFLVFHVDSGDGEGVSLDGNSGSDEGDDGGEFHFL